MPVCHSSVSVLPEKYRIIAGFWETTSSTFPLSHWYLAVTRSVSASPEVYRINWNSLGYDLFLRPLVPGSHLLAFACGVQDYGLFWEMFSGNAVLSVSWLDSGYMLLPVYVFLLYFSVFSAMLGSQWSSLCFSPGGRCTCCAGRVPARCCA